MEALNDAVLRLWRLRFPTSAESLQGLLETCRLEDLDWLLTAIATGTDPKGLIAALRRRLGDG